MGRRRRRLDATVGDAGSLQFVIKAVRTRELCHLVPDETFGLFAKDALVKLVLLVALL